MTKRIFVLALSLVMIGACKAGPPAITELRIGKTKDVAQPVDTFDARDTLYANARIDNAPQGGKAVGRLVIVKVEGQQAGPIPGLETTLDLGGPTNSADFTFTPPDAGWPNGVYTLEVVLLDGSGAEKDRKAARFETTGNAPAGQTPADQTTGDAK